MADFLQFNISKKLKIINKNLKKSVFSLLKQINI